jgi:ADP-heptose:LPS heptosyltransferase
MTFKQILKKIEQKNRIILYSVIRFFFKNKSLNIPISDKSIKKILIFRYDAIGDFVITTPLIELFKKKFPDCNLSILASNRNKDLSLFHPNVDKTFVFDGSFKSLFKNIFILKKEKYDLIFAGVFFKTTFAGIFANLIGGSKCIKVCVGHNERNEQYSTFFNLVIQPAERGTINMALLQQMIFIKAFGWDLNDAVNYSSLGLDESLNKKVSEKIINYQSNIKILYNISARNSWNTENHIKFIKLFQEKYPDFIIFLSSINEDNQKAFEIINNSNKNLIKYESENGILELCSLISQVNYVISPDTSIPHIATALKIPVIDIYPKVGTTHINEWIPFGERFEVVTTEEIKTIDYITPESVLNAFGKLMNR